LGIYLSDDQIKQAKEELSLVYALPFANDLVGTAWEQILAGVKGGVWSGLRDNRAKPDFYVPQESGSINYSVKTEGLKLTKERAKAANFLGHQEDFIVARPKVDDLLNSDEAIERMDVNGLGALILRYYDEQIVKKYKWHVISFLLRLNPAPAIHEFIYWEERPPSIYHPSDYWWRDSGKATGSNRNISGYPNSVDPELGKLPGAKFRWTSGGKQFYVLYEIPHDADIWQIEALKLTLNEVKSALQKRLRAKQRLLRHKSET